MLFTSFVIKMELDKQLQEIAENTRSKSGFQILVSGTNSRIVTTFECPIKLDPKKQYELALLNLETYYSFPNIDDKNNQFKYRKDKKTAWKTISIPQGCYEVVGINEAIQSAIGSTDITLKPNLNTLRCILCIAKEAEVDFTIPNCIRSVLGFDSKIYRKGVHSGEHSVHILRINSILVHTDIITNTYQDGRMEPIIYSFFPNVSPGEKIVEVQKNLIYAPLTIDTIQRMTTWLTDQDNQPLDLQGETLTIRFYLREC